MSNPIADSLLKIGIMRDFFSIAEQLRKHDSWTRAQLAAYQNEQLHKLRQHAYQNSPFYQRFHAGLMDRPLQDLPVLTKAMMMENFEDLVTDRDIKLAPLEKHIEHLQGQDRYLNRYWANVTSGTTGRHGIFLFNRAEWVVVVASYSRPYTWAGKKVSMTRRVKMSSVTSALPRHSSARIRATLPNWWTPSLSMAASDPLDSLTRRLNDWQPEVLMAYASITRILADEQSAGRLHIAPHTIFSLSEVLTDETRRRAQAVWGSQLFNQYGVTECGCLGAECTAHQGLHLAEDMVIVEAVDRNNQPVQPGQYSEKLLITSLFNYTQPLIRYELDDSVLMGQEACACGRPYALVKDIQGKVQENLYFPSAKGTSEIAVHPLVFKQIMEGEPVTGWQINQNVDGLSILLAGLPDEYDDQAFSIKLRQALEQQGIIVPALQVKRVTTIPRNASGKAPLVKSNLQRSV